MSQADSLVPKDAGLLESPSQLDASHRISEDPSERWEKAWQWCCERLNPIVIKEIRQSLKSRQFTISFGLTLVAAVGWTILAVALMVPRLYYIPGGLPLLFGFFCILAVPLLIIIPFTAFRSLTSETEDGTFELLRISALSSTQIIYGKMSSASVQILLYLSALAPCIVLTYLLRGVGLLTILLFLGGTVLVSILETAFALALAAVSTSRLVQTGVTVLFLIALLFIGFGWMTFVTAGLSEGSGEVENGASAFALGIFGALTIVALLITLALRSAAAAIDFASENSSTPVRLRLLGLIVVCLFWLCMGVVAFEDLTAFYVCTIILFCLFGFVGGLVTGERGVISPRTRRTLPRTFLGRVFLTWLYPGAGLGYMFLISLFAGWCVTVAAGELYFQSSYGSEFSDFSITVLGYVLLCYLAMYLGLNRLLMLAVPRQMPSRMMVSVTLLIVVVLLAHLIPLLAVYYANDYRDPVYGLHQVFNVYWTMLTISDGDFIGSQTSVLIMLTLFAVCIFGLNLALVTRDVMLVRVVDPPRVAEEKRQDEPPMPEPIDPLA
ncbi:MAG: ABC transporter permease [Aureliella sp.]